MPRADGSKSISVRPETVPRIRAAALLHGVSTDGLINMMLDGVDIEAMRASKPIGSVSMRCSGCRRDVLHRRVSSNRAHIRWGCLGCGRSRLTERTP